MHYNQLQFADEQWAEIGYVTPLNSLLTKGVRIPTPVSAAQLIAWIQTLRKKFFGR